MLPGSTEIEDIAVFIPTSNYISTSFDSTMFSVLGLFKDITCPIGSDCLLVNCIFSHRITKKRENGGNVDASYDPPAVADVLSPPPSKRRRVEDEVNLQSTSWGVQVASAAGKGTGGGLPEDSAAHFSQARTSQGKSEPLSSRPSGKSRDRLQNPVSARKSVSPPPIRRAASSVPVKVKKTLNPRPISHPPQSHPKRKETLTVLHAALARLNDQIVSDPNVNKQSVLSADELISMAHGEEERMALSTKDIDSYRSVTGQRVMKLRRMKLEEWKGLVLEHFKTTHVKATVKTADRASGELKKANEVESSSSIKLKSEQEIALLQHVRTPVEGLADYVTTPPSETEIANARRGLETSPVSEVCDRCKSRFTVFPGRNEEGKLTSKGHCHYHWAKLPKFVADARYDCCKEPAGSPPCEIAETHVFKVSNPKRLASIWQYARTPEHEDEVATKAISIDCEMGFTTIGMEMIRLSALSWPEGDEVLDVLVRPVGEVLDLNTRFSGVSVDQFNKAIPYGTQKADHGDSTSEDGELEPKRLERVDSPEAARRLLFDKMGPGTALIGHAIDNDLNVLRVIHPLIVDTVLLYPHPRGLPVRYGLKTLTNKYLLRDIQSLDTGHDSKEDAKAAGDLVRLKVHEKWKKMRSEGWAFEKGLLVAPKELELATRTSSEPRL